MTMENIILDFLSFTWEVFLSLLFIAVVLALLKGIFSKNDDKKDDKKD